MLIEWTQSGITFDWNRFPYYFACGFSVLISNVIIGYTVKEDDQPYACIRWRLHPYRSAIVGISILFVQVFAFWMAKLSADRKSRW